MGRRRRKRRKTSRVFVLCCGLKTRRSLAFLCTALLCGDRESADLDAAIQLGEGASSRAPGSAPGGLEKGLGALQVLPQTSAFTKPGSPGCTNAPFCPAGFCSQAVFRLFSLGSHPAGLGEAPGDASSGWRRRQLLVGMPALLLMLSLRVSFLSRSGWWEEMLSLVSGDVSSLGMRKLICICAQSSAEPAELST